MPGKANPQHLKLINRLKKIEKYKDDSICLTVKTWSHSDKTTSTKVVLWSNNEIQVIFKGNIMSALERFIDEKRKEAGLFQKKRE